jgi:hypothetical protein
VQLDHEKDARRRLFRLNCGLLAALSVPAPVGACVVLSTDAKAITRDVAARAANLETVERSPLAGCLRRNADFVLHKSYPFL